MKDASTLISASSDSTARIWRAGDNNTYSAVHTLKVQAFCLTSARCVWAQRRRTADAGQMNLGGLMATCPWLT